MVKVLSSDDRPDKIAFGSECDNESVLSPKAIGDSDLELNKIEISSESKVELKKLEIPTKTISPKMFEKYNKDLERKETNELKISLNSNLSDTKTEYTYRVERDILEKVVRTRKEISLIELDLVYLHNELKAFRKLNIDIMLLDTHIDSTTNITIKDTIMDQISSLNHKIMMSEQELKKQNLLLSKYTQKVSEHLKYIKDNELLELL